MESTRRQPDQDQSQLSSSSEQAQRPAPEYMKHIERRPGQSQPPSVGQRPESALAAPSGQARSMPGYAHGKTRITMTSLPPPPAPRGLARLLSKVFGGPVQPLRFFWRIARWLWLAAGLIVIGAGALDYLIELFTGNLPSVAEAFFDSPVLEIASRHPLRFPAAASLVLLLTVLSWGAAREHRRRLNARAERVRQAIRVGMGTNQVDEEMRGALLAGDSYGNFQLATQVHEEDRTTDAVWLYQLILEKEPKHFGANYNLGLIHAEAEHFDAAEGYCRTAILLNSESAEAQGLTAYVLYRLGLLEEAQRRARLAVRMGFSSQLLESLILPGLGVTSSLPATGAGKDMKW